MPPWWLVWAERIAVVLAEWWLARSTGDHGPEASLDDDADPPGPPKSGRPS